MLNGRRSRPNSAPPPPNGLAVGASSPEILAGATARSAESSRMGRPGNRATMAIPAWERSELNLLGVEERRLREHPLRRAAAGGDRR